MRAANQAAQAGETRSSSAECGRRKRGRSRLVLGSRRKSGMLSKEALPSHGGIATGERRNVVDRYPHLRPRLTHQQRLKVVLCDGRGCRRNAVGVIRHGRSRRWKRRRLCHGIWADGSQRRSRQIERADVNWGEVLGSLCLSRGGGRRVDRLPRGRRKREHRLILRDRVILERGRRAAEV